MYNISIVCMHLPRWNMKHGEAALAQTHTHTALCYCGHCFIMDINTFRPVTISLLYTNCISRERNNSIYLRFFLPLALRRGFVSRRRAIKHANTPIGSFFQCRFRRNLINYPSADSHVIGNVIKEGSPVIIILLTLLFSVHSRYGTFNIHLHLLVDGILLITSNGAS